MYSSSYAAATRFDDCIEIFYCVDIRQFSRHRKILLHLAALRQIWNGILGVTAKAMFIYGCQCYFL